jgi:hypothetical protein
MAMAWATGIPESAVHPDSKMADPATNTDMKARDDDIVFSLSKKHSGDSAAPKRTALSPANIGRDGPARQKAQPSGGRLRR